MLAANLKKVLEFMVTQANHDPYAPSTQKGVQVILDGRKVTFVSVTSGATTTVEMLFQKVSAGRGYFFLPFDEIENLYPPLGHNAEAEVVISKGEQPLLAGHISLRVEIGSWFVADMGLYKPAGLPKRSAIKTTVEIPYQTVKYAAGSLRTLAPNGKIFGHRKIADNSWEVSLPNPMFGTKSVVKLLY